MLNASALPADFRDLLIALADADAEFVVVGGYAVAAHGYVRATEDLYVLVRPSPANASKVFRALADFGAPVAAHGVTEDLFAKAGYGYRSKGPGRCGLARGTSRGAMRKRPGSRLR